MSQPMPMPRRELDLREVFLRVWQERRTVLAATLAAGVLSLGVAFLLPKWYRTVAVILPPEESDVLANMSLAQRALTKFPVFGFLSEYYTPADIYKAILLSRTVQEEVITAHDLRVVYRENSMEKVVRTLKEHYRVKLSPDGTIAISVEDRDPRRAAAMAATFLAALDRFNVERRNTQARRTRIFLERRVAEVDSLLRASEQALSKYQERHHTVAPPTDVSGDVQAAANLMARKISLEVRLGVLRSYLRDDNEQVVQARLELEKLKERIAELPALQGELVRLIRDAKIQEQLFLLLTSELEQARIRETMDTPTVQVLDAPVPAERHQRPRRLMIGLAGAILGLLGSAATVTLRASDARL